MIKKLIFLFFSVPFFQLVTNHLSQKKEIQKSFTNIETRNDHALFFVLADFKHWHKFPKNTIQQVRDIETELINNYGFSTEFIINPTRKQILNTLVQYQKKPFGKNDQLLIYFSTHGHYEENGTGALIPINGLSSDPTYDTWITHPLLADLVNKINCKHILLSLDACYSGTFGGNRGKPTGMPAQQGDDCSSKIESALQHKSRLYLTSGGVERTPTDSQFADKWLEALRIRNTDGILSYYNLLSVLTEAYPKPMDGVFRDHEIGGDFVFAKKSVCDKTLKKRARPSAVYQNEELEDYLMNPTGSNCIRVYMDGEINVLPPEFEKIEERKLVVSESTSYKIIPTEYKSKILRMQVQPELKCPEWWKPEWEKVTMKCLIQPESYRYIQTLNEYQTKKELILYKQGYKKWGKMEDFTCNGVTIVAGRTLCQYEIPDEYIEIQSRVLVKASTIEKVVVPAEYITYDEYRLVNKIPVRKFADAEKWIIRPAQYRDIKIRELVALSKYEEIVHPAEYKTVTTKKIIRNNSISINGNVSRFRELNCN